LETPNDPLVDCAIIFNLVPFSTITGLYFATQNSPLKYLMVDNTELSVNLNTDHYQLAVPLKQMENGQAIEDSRSPVSKALQE